MAGSIEEIAKGWLQDPAWQKVFKHTFDVLEDYVNIVLVSIGALTISVRLLTTLGSGDLTCILIGIENATDPGELTPYAEGGSMGMVNYAGVSEHCLEKVYQGSWFLEYLPYILMIQTIILLIMEKFTFRIPRIAQKVERFYNNIVEQSLFGKDPDVTEDLTDPKTSVEAISRSRQRNEICMSLKRSSIIHKVYLGKKVCEIIMGVTFVVINTLFAIIDQPKSSRCDIDTFPFPTIAEGRRIWFQCQAKKQSFFSLMLWAQVTCLSTSAALNFGSIAWCLCFRSVSRLLRQIQTMKEQKQHNNGTKWHQIGTTFRTTLFTEGEDFLFLFDLLAHTCGIESTLRVLTHSDEVFYEIFKPIIKLDEHIFLEEDKLKLSWEPAYVDRWLKSSNQQLHRQITEILVDSYEATIYPAESIQNTNTVSSHNGDLYSTWFYDLSGGKTEYVITVSCMIGKSRMRGAKVVTPLVPYGPEKPRTGMTKEAGVNEVEIFWDPPKGEFTKYSLSIQVHTEQYDGGFFPASPDKRLRLGSTQEPEPVVLDLQKRTITNLSNKLTTYTILGLAPASKYRIKLGTITGSIPTRQEISDVILTRPLPVDSLTVSSISSNSANLTWIVPEDQPCLRGAEITIQSQDLKTLTKIMIRKKTTEFTVTKLSPGVEYEFKIVAICQWQNKETRSTTKSLTFTTLPQPPTNLRLEDNKSTSLQVRWDPPAETYAMLKYKISVSNKSLEYTANYDVPSDRTVYNLSKLPDVVGTGMKYKVAICTSIINYSSEKEVQSDWVESFFYTRPLPPTGLSVDRNDVISWVHSETSSVTGYRVKWRTGEEKAEEVVVEGRENCKANLSGIRVETVYKVNIYALLQLESEVIESKELHEKVMRRSAFDPLSIVTQEDVKKIG